MLRVVAADGRNVGQRLATLAAACAVAGVVAAAAAGSAKNPPNWAAPQIATVVAHKLMGAKNVKKFRPNAALTNKTLTSLAADLKTQLGSPPPPGSDSGGTTTTGTTTTGGTTTTTTTTTGGSDPAAPETMAQLDKSLVQAIGLKKAASEFVQGARADGLAVPGRFGTEVVARLLGLRLNHPAAQDYLELRPQDPATRAEAAYSAAQILSFGVLADSWQIAQVKSLAATFSLPEVNDWQLQILDVAFSKIGMPYVWGGTSDNTETQFGVTARGGYDCSGFVWRVYKLQGYADEGTLASTIEGRTTYQMSVEVPAQGADRLQEAAARGRDLLRQQRPEVEGVADHAHRDLRRQRLVHPVLQRGRRARPAHRLVQAEVRLGPAAAPRGRTGTLERGGVPPFE